jgi:hypothetical protein
MYNITLSTSCVNIPVNSLLLSQFTPSVKTKSTFDILNITLYQNKYIVGTREQIQFISH